MQIQCPDGLVVTWKSTFMVIFTLGLMLNEVGGESESPKDISENILR